MCFLSSKELASLPSSQLFSPYFASYVWLGSVPFLKLIIYLNVRAFFNFEPADSYIVKTNVEDVVFIFEVQVAKSKQLHLLTILQSSSYYCNFALKSELFILHLTDLKQILLVLPLCRLNDT